MNATTHKAPTTTSSVNLTCCLIASRSVSKTSILAVSCWIFFPWATKVRLISVFSPSDALLLSAWLALATSSKEMWVGALKLSSDILIQPARQPEKSAYCFDSLSVPWPFLAWSVRIAGARYCTCNPDCNLGWPCLLHCQGMLSIQTQQRDQSPGFYKYLLHFFYLLCFDTKGPKIQQQTLNASCWVSAALQEDIRGWQQKILPLWSHIYIISCPYSGCGIRCSIVDRRSSKTYMTKIPS